MNESPKQQFYNFLTELPNSPATGKLFGTYRGVVLFNEDPLRLGRCKVYIPSVHGAQQPQSDEIRWANPCAPFGGAAESGMAMVPDVGATVWVAFECGDIDFPIIMGTWHGAPAEAEETPRRVYRSLRGGETPAPQTKALIRAGETALYTDPVENVLQGLAGDSVIELDGQEHRVLLSAESGTNKVYLLFNAETPSLELVVVSAGVVTSALTLSGGDVVLRGTGALVALAGSNATLAGGAAAQVLAGSNATLAGGAAAHVLAGAEAVVAGSTVNLNPPSAPSAPSAPDPVLPSPAEYLGQSD